MYIDCLHLIKTMAFPLQLFSQLAKILLLLSLLIFVHTPTTNSQEVWKHYCPPDANFTSGSMFDLNLNLLLLFVYSTTTDTSFTYHTFGDSPDKVYALAICRGDISQDKCSACIMNSVQQITNLCPLGRYSGVWYDCCFFHYSDKNIFGSADTSFYTYSTSVNDVAEPLQFNDLLGNLMSFLANKAAYNSSQMFAAGKVKFKSSDMIYGLAMCTRDLREDECFRCLTYLIEEIPNCCDGKDGARLSGWNCDLRYDLNLFYNATAVSDEMVSLPPSTPPVSSSPPNRPASPGTNGATKTITIVVASAGGATLALVISTIIYLRMRKPDASNSGDGKDEQELMSSESLLLDFSMLKAATNDFSDANKLGEGGFGPVYKGILGSLADKQEIAVKRLSRTSGQGIVELRNEVVLLAKLQHRNLVRLLGCCLEESEKLLVYEYLSLKSLDKVLFDSNRRKELDWGKRYKIIEGISRGLLYLHEDSQLKIVHRDLKVSNILLDGDMNPKISDFGLAKLFDVEETHRNTNRIVGTYGYMAPEYVLHGVFSTKSDVYSYGIIMLEILAGRRNSCYEEPGQLIDLVWQKWIEGNASEVIDIYLRQQCRSQDMVRCLHIALLCIQDEPSDRPTMASVILMLNSCSMTVPTPRLPAFLSRSNTPY